MHKKDIGSTWYVIYGDLVIQTMDRISTTNMHPNRNSTFWVLGIVYSGERTIEVENQQFTLKAGDYFLLPPNVLHGGVKVDTHDVFFVHFFACGKQFEPSQTTVIDHILLPMVGKIPRQTTIFQLIESINKEFKLNLAGNQFFSAHIQVLLHQISLSMQKKEIGWSDNHCLADEIFEFLNNHTSTQISAIALEKQFHLSYKQLNNIFKRQFKITIKQKTLDLKIQKACNLLINGETIESVVVKTGFNDYFYFLKCFKKKVGLTPKEFQKKSLSEQ
ncbi:AraC family transcriptional regulator [Oceanobacillus sojae]|uniref:helix-turn-helix domain-containing protein n=1 Tax=Oceanobacillus sojae TaxID=582851 RepID=UPI0021A5652F|nr:AraC family transcriptional regulator [Oceanobacillus sojae]MCT1905243.1 AraC family transcriptional regulator [Oceanobacillus sojae]